MDRRGVRIVDTFAEAFDMRAARVLITAQSPAWAQTAARSMTGFATSVIGCKVEAGIEADLTPDQTPDGRPGASVLLFGFDTAGLGTRLLERVGQTVLTCPTTACFDGLPQAAERVNVGGLLRHFGDRFQSSKFLDGHRYWRIPVMEGEFVVEEAFGVQKAIGGGNFLILGEEPGRRRSRRRKRRSTSCERFPASSCRSPAASCAPAARWARSATRRWSRPPTTRTVRRCADGLGVASELPEGVNSVLEIVVDGLDRAAIEAALRAGIEAACRPGVVEITAGNYGGKLGKHHFRLREARKLVLTVAERGKWMAWRRPSAAVLPMIATRFASDGVPVFASIPLRAAVRVGRPQRISALDPLRTLDARIRTTPSSDSDGAFGPTGLAVGHGHPLELVDEQGRVPLQVVELPRHHKPRQHRGDVPEKQVNELHFGAWSGKLVDFRPESSA